MEDASLALRACMNFGIIGAGNIGSTLAKLAIDHGHTVVIANSRSPDTLGDLIAELGPSARAATAQHAAASGDIAIVTIPLMAYQAVPVEPLVGKTVIDTNNYYPQRDGQLPELDDGSTTSAELLAGHLPKSHVVKAFNHLYFAELASQGEPAGTPGRRALAVAGDDPGAKRQVMELIEEFGFDPIDAGRLSEGRRYQPGTPAYGPRLDAAQLRAALSAA